MSDTTLDKTDKPRTKRRKPSVLLENGSRVHNHVELTRLEPVTSLAPSPGKKNGRPSAYSDALADKICSYLAEGKTLLEACEQDTTLPPHSIIRKWAYHNYQGFGPKYMEACRLGFYAMAEQLFKIADDGSNDWIQKVTATGTAFQVPNMEHIARSRLRIDARKWWLSKLFPQQFGEKLDVAITTNNDSDLGILLAQVCTPAELDDLRNRLMAYKAKQVAASTSNNDTRDSAAHSRDDT